MRTLRTQLVAWYVGVAAIVVLFIAVLACIAVFEVLSYEARQSLESAIRKAPPLIASYEKTHQDDAGLETFLGQQLAPLGVFVHVHRHILPDMHFPLTNGPAAFMLPDGRVSIQLGAGPEGFDPPQGGPGQVIGSIRPGPFTMPPKDRIVSGLEPPFFVRLYALRIHPVIIRFANGEAVLFVDLRLQPTMGLLWTAVALFAVVVMSGAWRIALVVARQTLEPLVRTTDALNRFGDGDFTPEAVSTSDRSEVGALASAFNRAVEQITRAFAERSRTDAEMRQFVADAGHQLRTPLTVIMGHLSAMEAKAESPRQAIAYRSMLAQSRRMRSLIDDLITLARLEHEGGHTPEVLDVNELCARVPLCFDEAAQQRIAVRTVSPALAIRGDEGDLLGALSALVDNGLKYAPSGSVDITVSQLEGRCLIEIADRGPGMSEEDMRGAFDRFYRGGAADGIDGTGLGLAIVRKAIERAEGTVTLRSRDGGGLVCTVSLPIHAVGAAPQKNPRAAAAT
jgi:signal transduction histidine kinase